MGSTCWAEEVQENWLFLMEQTFDTGLKPLNNTQIR